MIKNHTLNALQKAINLALALDETTESKIQALQGKTIELVIKPLEISFFIRFANGELHLLSTFEGQADTTIQSSPLGLIRLSLLPVSKVRSLFNDQVTITGDVELGQKLKRLFDELDIDWEGHLAQFTGDVVAYQVGSFFRQGVALKNQATTTLRENAAEYLQEELRLFPTREEINDFLNDVDELSLRVERLTAHVNLLLAQNEID